jgi:hypothetical protein
MEKALHMQYRRYKRNQAIGRHAQCTHRGPINSAAVYKNSNTVLTSKNKQIYKGRG